jgi:hypothetical protein
MKKKSKAKPQEPRLPKLPDKPFGNATQISRGDCIALLKEHGVELSSTLLQLMKLPAYLFRGTNAELEFYDPLSVPPYPYADEHSPSKCYDKKKSAPSWVSGHYLGLEDKGKKRYLIFVDARRFVFLKEEIGKMDEIESQVEATSRGLPPHLQKK